MSAKGAKVIIWLFGLLGWLIVYLADKTLLEDEGVKLYLNEMLVLAIVSAVAGIVSATVIGLIIGGPLGIAWLVFWIWGLVYILQDKDVELPLVGKLKFFK